MQFEGQVVVRTEVFSQRGEAGEKDVPDPRTWRIDCRSEQQSQARVLSFYPENAEEAFCRIGISATGELLSSRIPGARGNVLEAEGLLLVPGYPAPCDILPQKLLAPDAPDAPDAPLSFTIQRTIGGERFADEICVSSRRISAAAAEEKGWLKIPADDISASLHLVKAVNCRSGELVCQQLWQPEGGWWLYEETPHRRSWRIETPGN